MSRCPLYHVVVIILVGEVIINIVIVIFSVLTQLNCLNIQRLSMMF